MTARLSSEEVYDRAASWAARIDAGSLSSEEQAVLEAWLAADTRHYGALAQASALLVPAQKPRSMRVVEPVRPPRRSFNRKSVV